VTDTIIPNCPSCAALREQLRLLADDNLRLLDLTRSLAARARLLEESIVADEPREVVAFHALLLLKMGKARGLW
jgi:hypothetical protein